MGSDNGTESSGGMDTTESGSGNGNGNGNGMDSGSMNAECAIPEQEISELFPEGEDFSLNRDPVVSERGQGINQTATGLYTGPDGNRVTLTITYYDQRPTVTESDSEMTATTVQQTTTKTVAYIRGGDYDYLATANSEETATSLLKMVPSLSADCVDNNVRIN